MESVDFPRVSDVEEAFSGVLSPDVPSFRWDLSEGKAAVVREEGKKPLLHSVRHTAYTTQDATSLRRARRVTGAAE